MTSGWHLVSAQSLQKPPVPTNVLPCINQQVDLAIGYFDLACNSAITPFLSTLPKHVCSAVHSGNLTFHVLWYQVVTQLHRIHRLDGNQDHNIQSSHRNWIPCHLVQVLCGSRLNEHHGWISLLRQYHETLRHHVVLKRGPVFELVHHQVINRQAHQYHRLDACGGHVWKHERQWGFPRPVMKRSWERSKIFAWGLNVTGIGIPTI